MVQNAVARILIKARNFDHIIPILASLHWLPIHVRSDLQISYLPDPLILNPGLPALSIQGSSD